MSSQAVDSGRAGIFDFISDQRFRLSLLSDYSEILASLETGSWKAVHVLAGGIVEAVLVDYLVASDYQKRTGRDPLEFDLFKAIEACKAEGVLSQRAFELSSVVRGYRNLIHPGRAIRLNEKVDKNTAVIAKALVDVIIDEIAVGKKAKYGYTAEQLMSKVESDSSSLSIIGHLHCRPN